MRAQKLILRSREKYACHRAKIEAKLHRWLENSNRPQSG
jgi:hypothetical protein